MASENIGSDYENESSNNKDAYETNIEIDTNTLENHLQHANTKANALARCANTHAKTPQAVRQAGAEANVLAEYLNIQEAATRATQLKDIVNERTIAVNRDIDEDKFFSSADGHTTVTNRYDLEKAVPQQKKAHFKEIERYWVNEPYSFVILFRSTKENEIKYYAIEPHQSRIEHEIENYVISKLQKEIKYGDFTTTGDSLEQKLDTITTETHKLLSRYQLYDGESQSMREMLREVINVDDISSLTDVFSTDDSSEKPTANPDNPPGKQLDGIAATPLTDELLEDDRTLTEYQVEKLLYYLQRDFIGYEKIDPIKHDINIEDISCDGYNSPVFAYHTEYEQIITNIHHSKNELDDFVVKLAQQSGKGISKRQPQVDATLPDGSRAQLTLGKEVSDHGTNYTIRQFKEVPFTPIDLINWGTFSLDQMALLWLAIENEKSLIFAGGTASGKTTSLNAVSLFIPSNTKIVSIEDTREVELPQRNWVASVTRPSFTEGEKGDIDEFDLLEAALRQRPDYIVMGEIRGEEGRTLFQVMSTGHTTYTTFHADTVGEVIKRFTTDPINVSKTMFTALDLVSIQTSTRVNGKKVRRSKTLTEINHYDTEDDEINVQDIYQWRAETDEFQDVGNSSVLEEIKFDQGWQQHRLDQELFERKVVLAYLIDNGLKTYTEVAATAQAFINDSETILSLIANGNLEESLRDLREMESVLIDIDEDVEKNVPRPKPDDEQKQEVKDVLRKAKENPLPRFNDPSVEKEKSLFDIYQNKEGDPLAETLVKFLTEAETHPHDVSSAGEDLTPNTEEILDEGKEEATTNVSDTDDIIDSVTGGGETNDAENTEEGMDSEERRDETEKSTEKYEFINETVDKDNKTSVSDADDVSDKSALDKQEGDDTSDGEGIPDVPLLDKDDAEDDETETGDESEQ